MLRRGLYWWRSQIEALRFRYSPPFADFLVRRSTLPALTRLAKSAKLGILIDNTVLDHATTHETAWVSTETQKWGPNDIDCGYIARIAVHDGDSTSREYQNICYLPGLISLAKEQALSLWTSAELQAEQFYQPSGRFRGYGMSDFNLFGGVKLESVDGLIFPEMGPAILGLPSARDQIGQRLTKAAADDPEYASLVQVLGPNNSQDAFHIRTAEKQGMHCFLTMDFKLMKTLVAQSGTSRIKALKTKVLTPEQLGLELGLLPVPPHIFSYVDASFPVRSDLAWPGGKRRGVRRPRAPKQAQ